MSENEKVQQTATTEEGKVRQRVRISGDAASRIADLARKYDLPKATVADVVTQCALEPDGRAVDEHLQDLVRVRQMKEEAEKARMSGDDGASDGTSDLGALREHLVHLEAQIGQQTKALGTIQTAILGASAGSGQVHPSGSLLDNIRAMLVVLENVIGNTSDQEESLASIHEALNALGEQVRTLAVQRESAAGQTGEDNPEETILANLSHILSQVNEKLDGQDQKSERILAAIEDHKAAFASVQEAGSVNDDPTDVGLEIDAFSQEVSDRVLAAVDARIREVFAGLTRTDPDPEYLAERVAEHLGGRLNGLSQTVQAIQQQMDYVLHNLPEQPADPCPNPGVTPISPEVLDAALAEMSQRLDVLMDRVGLLISEAGQSFYLAPSKPIGRAFLGKLRPVRGEG